MNIVILLDQKEESRYERARLLAEILVIALVAVAVHEGLNTLRDSVANHAAELRPALSLFTMFFLTAIRFFIGNHLQLQDPVLLAKEKKWLLDLMMVLVQTVILCFLGCVSPLAEGQPREWFLMLLILLYGSDFVWIFGLQLLQRRYTWGKRSWPWKWGLLNSVLLVATVLMWRYLWDSQPAWGLLTLFLVNGVLAFVIDLWMDVHQLIHAGGR
jgi:hypothetical protein